MAKARARGPRPQGPGERPASEKQGEIKAAQVESSSWSEGGRGRRGVGGGGTPAGPGCGSPACFCAARPHVQHVPLAYLEQRLFSSFKAAFPFLSFSSENPPPPPHTFPPVTHMRFLSRFISLSVWTRRSCLILVTKERRV